MYIKQVAVWYGFEVLKHNHTLDFLSSLFSLYVFMPA